MEFYKYQGAGNDFIMIDDRKKNFIVDKIKIQKICNRHFGVGADGLILLQNDEILDFKMVYFNSDGNESSMCGNGGRCIVRFAQELNIIQNQTKFLAIDGEHEAIISENDIKLKMGSVGEVVDLESCMFLNTGSPHHIEFVNDIKSIDVKQKGAEIRYGKTYFEEGTNVNFVQVLSDNELKVRTYERGVEDETLACGTGVTAAAIAAFHSGKVKQEKVKIRTLGGVLNVQFEKKASNTYENIWLTGPAELVFKGEINI